MPPCLFDKMGMQKSNKSTLDVAFSTTGESNLDSDRCILITDGNFLLQDVYEVYVISKKTMFQTRFLFVM